MALAEGDRRADHGHVPPLDGGRDPGDHVRMSGAGAARGLQCCRAADGHAGGGAEPWRARAAAACARLRAGSAVARTPSAAARRDAGAGSALNTVGRWTGTPGERPAYLSNSHKGYYGTE